MKFEVECKEEDTRVEIYCAAKPGLLLSTVSTLDTLGLESSSASSAASTTSPCTPPAPRYQ